MSVDQCENLGQHWRQFSSRSRLRATHPITALKILALKLLNQVCNIHLVKKT